MKSNNNTIIETKKLEKGFKSKGKIRPVLKSVDLRLKAGESVAIIGPSGSGKSTILHLAAGLLEADSGTITFSTSRLDELSDKQKTRLRNHELGFIFQSFNLLDHLDVMNNIALPLLIAGKSTQQALKSANKLVRELGLKDVAHAKPTSLSGGEKQRVAIARALINNPKLILADEPTGNLDEKNAKRIIDRLLALCADRNVSLLVVTHDKKIANRCDRTLELSDAKLKSPKKASK